MASRRSHLILVGLLLLALVGVALLGVPGSPIKRDLRKGLDLQGGLEIVLQAQPPKGHKLTGEDLDRSVDIMRNRVDKLGVSEPEIRKQDPNQIVIELAGVHNAAEAASLIGKTAQLELYDLETSLVAPSVGAGGVPVASTRLYDLLTRVQARAAKGEPTAYYLFDTKTKRRIAGPAPTLNDLKKDPAVVKQNGGDKNAAFPPEGTKVLQVPAKTAVVTCSASTAVICPGVNLAELPPRQNYFYLFKHDLQAKEPVPQLTGQHLKLSGTRQDFEPTSGQPIVTMQFTKKGNGIFHDVTRDEAIRGSISRNPQHFAIVLDNEIRSFPQIEYDKYPDGIDPTGGGAQITGMKNLDEAKKLALVLQTGALPVNFNTVERTDVSATLGADSLKQARNAALVGLLVVMLFLLVVYRFLGVVAVIGLGIYAAFMYAAILLFNVTLTLPGFAGLVLTIGVAADANIVIFERIKEEARAGKSVRAAIAAGYQKGFHTIVDANVVTCITALVLFAVATAGVKGFALMLLIGTVISLVTAVAATRAMLGLLGGFRWFDNPRFMGAGGGQRGRWLQIDFIGRRNLWLAISAAFLAITIGSLAVNGLNLGIDFRGGTQITFSTPQPVGLSDVRDHARTVGQGDAVIQGRGQSAGEDRYREFQIRTKHLAESAQNRLSSNLRDAYGEDIPLGIKNVSSSFGRQIMRSAILAILFSLVLIVLYITIRFHGIAFAVPVIIAMFHDVLIPLGVYSIFDLEVSASTVAAVLTVLGFSIYDTIIIFDRVRENIPLMRRESFATIANVSLWETIRRSLATSFITLLPVLSLFLLGGDTLKDFAVALMVGITAGAYSSIFIATPLLAMWKEREPEYARRKDSAVVDGLTSDRVLAEAERAAAEAPAPRTPVDEIQEAVAAVAGDGDSEAKRERRRQRRRTRPHGRAR
ncbi:MAG TPA: protein translocase subunit SecD [Gaiellaceae bacterium]|nr:protein translocase subunit SecD [Gaiellaceae bacterium]